LLAPTVVFETLVKKGEGKNAKTAADVLGRATLVGGAGTVALKASVALNKPIVIMYSGSGDFAPGTVTPPELTKRAFK
jgi:hypothetical protein